MCDRPSPTRLLAFYLLLIPIPAGAQAPGNAKFAGTFSNDEITVISSAGGKGYAGTIVMRAADGNRRFAFQATEEGGALVGAFNAGDRSHEFRATIEDGTLVLRTGNAEHR